MIIIAEQPLEFSLGGNQILLKVASFDGAGMEFYRWGSRTELRTDGLNGLPDNEDLTLSWTDPTGLVADLDFVTDADPDQEINFLPYYDVLEFPTLIAYWEAVAAKIQAHPWINPVFVIYATNNGGTYSLWARVRNYEEGWTLAWSGDETDWAVFAHADLSTNIPDEYEVHVNVYMETEFDGGEYVHLGEMRGEPDATSNLLINLSEILMKGGEMYLPARPIPEWDTASPYLNENIKRYFIRVHESVPTPDPDFDSLHYINDKKVIVGGISAPLFAIDPAYMAGIDETNSLLTWRPDGQKIGANHPYFLAFYAFDDFADAGETVYLQVEVTTAVVTGTLFFYLSDAVQPEQGQIVVFPVSPLDLGLTDEALKYRVRVIKTGIVEVSPWRTFYIDREVYESERYLMYLNGFFCPEVVRCTGFLEEALQVNKTESEAVLDPAYDELYRQFRYTDVDWKDLFTYHTGYLRPTDVRSLKELLISRYVYEISETGYVPLQVVGKNYQIAKTAQNLNSLAIEAYPALLNRFYSDLSAITPPTIQVWGSNNDFIWASPLSIPWG